MSAGVHRELHAQLLHQVLDLAAADVRAEELRGEIRHLVRLVEHHGIRRAEQVAEAILLQRQIRQQQVMIDDDDVGLERLAPRGDHVAAGEFRAALAEAIVARRGDLRPDGCESAKSRHFGEVAALRWCAPSARCARACLRRRGARRSMRQRSCSAALRCSRR